MTRRNLGTVAVIAFALTAPTPALAAPRELHVQTTGGDGACTGNVCNSITAAAASAAPDDTITIHPKPGGWSESPVTFTAANLTVRGTGTEVIVRTALTFSYKKLLAATSNATIQRMTVLPATGAAVAVQSPSGDVDPKTVTIDSSILSGSGTNPGLTVNTLMGTTVNARHVTIADSGSAPATSIGSNSSASFTGSIVNGTTSGTNNFGGSDTTTAKSALFADTANEDFHLRADAPAIDAGGSVAAGELNVDVDGQARQNGSHVDQGADEFYDRAPSAPTLTAAPQFAYIGDVITATASSTDPDPGGSINHFHWDFGDGTLLDGPSPQTHSYSVPNTYTITVYAVDNNGLAGPASHFDVGIFARPPPPPGGGSGGGGIQPLPKLGSAAEAANLAADFEPPQVSIATPRPGQRLRIGRGLPGLGGGVADDSGVLSVELALVRHRGVACDWYDGRRGLRAGSCARIVWFRAVVDDFAWRYAFPAGARLAPGAYTLAVRATDVRRNSTPLGVSAARAGAFRFVR